MTDKDLLILLSKSDTYAYRMLYIQHYKMIEYFILKNSGTCSDAQDIFQDALIVLFEKTRNNEFKLSSSLKTYLYSIVRNLWLKKLRDHKVSLSLKDIEPYEDVEDTSQVLALDMKLNAVEKALEFLGEKCKDILVKFYYYHLKMDEIAVVLNYSNAETVKSQKYKCLQQLKKIMTNE
jgi:RNA polymerase sigma factor (sigma-70 family)